MVGLIMVAKQDTDIIVVDSIEVIARMVIEI